MYDALQNGDQEYSWKELSLLAFYDFFITQVETKRKDFIEYCKVHGVPTAYNQYESAIRTMEKLLSVNADEEYESDTCENMLNRAKTLPEAKTQDFPSKLKKFIEYKNAVYNNDAQENGSQKGATLMTVENNTENNISINTILYGPPGTGKTYNTVLYAVAICDEHTSLEELKDKAKSKDGYNEILAKYNKLISEDRIAFTTFHQSYGYEDFIEGIKPKIINDNVTYKVDSGIFKRFCENFDNSNLDNIFQKFELNDYPTVWKATLGESGENSIRTDCLENGHIRVGFDFYGPEISSDTDFSIDGGNRVLSNFINDMKIGDVILSCYDTRHIDAIGIVTGDYEWQESYPDHKRLRQVDWIVKDVKIDIVDLNGGRRMMPPTLYKMKVSLEDVKNLVFENITSSFSESKNKVFIIDEINRGNVSKIFGELITLIEEEKRDKSKVVLPYSAKEFTVPKNVYILGTMNTADRSLALMDTALRRRFDFVEMMPDADIFTENNSDIMVEDVSVKRLLEIMNKRIEFLYDREHTIGHAYFKDFLDKENRNIETLRRIFIKKIIPLLQEYFYDDYERIRLVLGDNQIKDNDMCFIKENEKMTNVFFGKTDIDMEAKTYTVNEKIKTFGAKRFVEIYEASDKGE
ncbi:MAG: AAA family ATPase [Clostridia bacterium]|nr:AAA family ATPase [Clostridia bacterium]